MIPPSDPKGVRLQPTDDTARRKQREEAARSARKRLWPADIACYYAQRPFSQTGKADNRRIRKNCQRETADALKTVLPAERASVLN